MSKMDNLRAMREARYEESQARAKASAGSAAPKAKAPPPAPAPLLAVVPDSPADLYSRGRPRGQEPPLRLTKAPTP